MNDEILEALTKANAVDQETGLTIEKLMKVTGRNLDTVVLHTQLLLRDRKVQVSSADMLSRNFQHVWPNVTGRDVTGEDVAKAVREEKERNLYPLLVWLGPVILKELEEKRKADELREAMIAAAKRETVAIHGPNMGNVAVGADIQQTQQSGDHSSSSQRNKNEKTAHITNKKRNAILKAIGALVTASLATYIGGKLLELF